jgi:hypothetical protein
VKIKTGQTVSVSGQYKPVGGKTESTFVEGNRVPPTKTNKQEWVLVDKTNTKTGNVKMGRHFLVVSPFL